MIQDVFVALCFVLNTVLFSPGLFTVSWQFTTDESLVYVLCFHYCVCSRGCRKDDRYYSLQTASLHPKGTQLHNFPQHDLTFLFRLSQLTFEEVLWTQ